MKRSILASVSALALFSAAPAFAQSSSTVYQNALSAPGGTDTRTVTATVDQSGTQGSRSNIEQREAAESRVDVVQTDNGSGPGGQANRSDVRTENASGGATVAVNQNHTYGGYDSNVSNVQQGRNAYNSDIAVNQTGGQNTSTVTTRTTDGTLADVRQNGANNGSYVEQAFQRTSAAYVDQTGFGGQNNATIQQIGDGFSVNPAEFGNANFAQAVQFGNNLTSNILQDGGPGTSSNFARSNQNGNGDVSSIAQYGTDGSADVIQSGDSHESYVTQSGTDNRAYVEQRATNGYSSVNQSGTDNYGQIRQLADNNVSTLSQSGTNSDAYVTQSTANNNSAVTQQGSNATVVVTQH